MDALTRACQKIFFECKRAEESCCTIYCRTLSKWQLAEKLQESALWKVDLAPLVQFEFRFLPPFSWHSLQGIGIEFWLAWISGHSFVSNSICNPIQNSGKVYLKIHDCGWDLRMQTWAGCNCWLCPVDPIELQFFASFSKGTKSTDTRKYKEGSSIRYIEYIQMYWTWTFSSRNYTKRMKLPWHYNSFVKQNLQRALLDKGSCPSISNVIWILSSDTLFVSLTKYFQIVRRQCCLRSKGDIFKIYWVTQ